MEATVQKTWKPKVAGILDIVGVGVGLLSAGMSYLVFNAMDGDIFTQFYTDPALADLGSFMQDMMQTVWVWTFILAVIAAVFGVIGGVYALKRRKWGLALTGSIVMCFSSLVFGILSLIIYSAVQE